jgi:hypothetical protein
LLIEFNEFYGGKNYYCVGFLKNLWLEKLWFLKDLSIRVNPIVLLDELLLLEVGNVFFIRGIIIA